MHSEVKISSCLLAQRFSYAYVGISKRGTHFLPRPRRYEKQVINTLCKVIKPWCPRTYTVVFSCVVCVDVCVRDLQRPQPAFKQVSEKQLVLS